MPIHSIIINIVPAKNDVENKQRQLIFDGDHKQWKSSDGGIYPGEIKLIAGIDEVRQKVTV